jgi:ABC-type sugar transport system ATPase subunit
VSLTVNAGEVLGVAGLIGAGRSELAEAICGVGPRRAGRVLLDGEPWGFNPRAMPFAPASAWYPEDRRHRGVIGAMTIRENITLPALGAYSRLGIVRRAAEAGPPTRLPVC